MIYKQSDFPNSFDAEQLRLDMVAAFGPNFVLMTSADQVIARADDFADSAIDQICKNHFAKDWTKVTNTGLKIQIANLESTQARMIREAALGGDNTRLKALDAQIAGLRSQLK